MEFFDITTLILGVGALALFVWKLFVAPKIPDATMSALIKAAHIAVYAAEAIFGRGFGEEKALEALVRVKSFLAKFNIKFDEDSILAAIKSEWQKMNQEQIRDGVKEPEALPEE